jgi:hypothetical protein
VVVVDVSVPPVTVVVVVATHAPQESGHIAVKSALQLFELVRQIGWVSVHAAAVWIDPAASSSPTAAARKVNGDA